MPEYCVSLRQVSGPGTLISSLAGSNSTQSSSVQSSRSTQASGETTLAMMSTDDEARMAAEPEDVGTSMEEDWENQDPYQEDQGVVPTVSVNTETVFGKERFNEIPIEDRLMEEKARKDGEASKEVISREVRKHGWCKNLAIITLTFIFKEKEEESRGQVARLKAFQLEKSRAVRKLGNGNKCRDACENA